MRAGNPLRGIDTMFLEITRKSTPDNGMSFFLKSSEVARGFSLELCHGLIACAYLCRKRLNIKHKFCIPRTLPEEWVHKYRKQRIRNEGAIFN